MTIHDLIGVGFGPSNLALAIALQEQPGRSQPPDALFLEKQPGFAWHGDMMLDGTHMQISFLKDLATLRNPASPYTFINYLHQKRRLSDFINLKTFYPSRLEFNDYLAWAASHFDAQCRYGEEVIEVLPEKRGSEVSLLRVLSRDSNQQLHERLTRNLVLGIGGVANIPDCMQHLRGEPRVFHSSRFRSAFARQQAPRRIAIIGAGQSATEIFLELDGHADIAVDLITRARTIKPSDDSPFVNEIFNPDYTDYVFNTAEGSRAALLDEFMQTNYAAPDMALIERMFEVLYRQKVSGVERHRFLRRHDTLEARADEAGVHLWLNDLETGQVKTLSYDAVILATGYQRQQHHELLKELKPYLPDMRVDRHYRLVSTPQFRPAIFLQGSCEASHGLSDTLLSITAIRTNEIRDALARSMAPTQAFSALHQHQAGEMQRQAAFRS
ncbi:lysine N(6)-hydroxylase/L-ornithine N(5)-oxygenase family protein [Herbaspirillum sp. YR522]|uniref:lysine N(6)-hydroxylase/L-ornithine N(5)-oxygenase family protein n=1 Tax=Herbaspirillum sp. YR522 TaxID=1144342 RepID=UPI00026FC539|nr:lysine N(6)-hydroxylase/L-ornithine N(5)-oxygenase family protein [Herbaspirillum sp. YR522]EJM97625.1 lysine/ornithine N-monooxygenase [Herbaspirillum sp. YR522]